MLPTAASGPRKPSSSRSQPADKPGNVTAVVGGKFFFTLGGRPEQQLKDMQMLNWQVDPPKWENPESGPTAPAIRSAIWRCGAVACPIKGSSQMLVFG